MKKQKFVIVSPRNNSGGVTVLHILCKCLVELGYDAKMFYVKDYKYTNENKSLYWKNYFFYLFSQFLGIWFPYIQNAYGRGEETFEQLSIKCCKRKYIPFVDKNTIVIYPEIIYGNMLGASNVVRWLLYNYKYYGDKNAYDERDVFIAYREVFNDVRLNSNNSILYLNYFNLDLYKQTNYGKREGTCYIIRKGKNRKDLPRRFEGEIVDNLSEKEKVEVFNKCKYCISYDTQTAYSGMAAICGCISIVIPESGKSRSDYMKGDDISYGLAFGIDEAEIQYAISTRKKLVSVCKQLNEKSIEETKKFVDFCKTIF